METLLGQAIGNGRYVIKDEVSSNGTVMVFVAFDQRLGIDVVVKTVAEQASDHDAERLVNEGRVCAALRHPNVCVVSDMGRLADRRPYLVMEHLIGETLRERLQEGELELAHAVEVTSQLLSVLSVAHDAGVIHRDVKPENIFLARVFGRQPLVKVIDFGVAKGAEQGITATGALVGTPAYMAPEQASGDFATLRSDLYSVGIVFYESVTGVRPFKGKGPKATLDAILAGGARPLSQMRPSISREISGVIARAMDVDPSKRWPSAAVFLEALEQAFRPGESWQAATRRLPPLPTDEDEQTVRDFPTIK